jgi:biopolymer transport protein ExbB
MNSVEYLFSLISNGTYVLQAIIALWGAYCVALVWRRLAMVNFRNDAEQDSFLNELEERLREGKPNAANELCDDDRRALPQLTLYALEHEQLAGDELKETLGDRFQQDVLDDLDRLFAWIATCIKTAPQMGLFGTVTGMMSAFARMGSGAKVDSSKMAQDISFALITTIIGLATAVPLILASAALQIRLKRTLSRVAFGIDGVSYILGQVTRKGKN